MDSPITDISAPRLSGVPLGDQIGVRVGFPDVAVQAAGGSFRNSFIEYVKGTGTQHDGIVKISDERQLPGLSGGALLFMNLSENKASILPNLVGLNVGRNTTLSLLTILKDAEIKVPGTKADILKAIQTGQCN